MTKGNPKWENFERVTQELLGLRSTPGSGNQWHDVGDGRSKADDSYRVIMDCKYTMRATYSLNGDVLQVWWDTAAVSGYHFALPIYFEGAQNKPKDWVVITLDDYSELLDSIRTTNYGKRCGEAAPAQHNVPCCRRSGHFDNHDNGKIEWSR